jgi:hypothetical protein
MKNFLNNLKIFAINCINAGNFVLHLMLGAGIAMLFLKWERDFIGQIAICTVIPFVICGILEYGQGFIPNVKRNIYDVFNSAIGGFIVVLIYLTIYGFKWGTDIGPQEPKMFWHYGGWVLIVVSILIWTVKQLNKRFK